MKAKCKECGAVAFENGECGMCFMRLPTERNKKQPAYVIPSGMTPSEVEAYREGRKDGFDEGYRMGEAEKHGELYKEILAPALCLAEAVREGQRRESISRFIFIDLLIERLENVCGGPTDGPTEPAGKLAGG